MPQYCANVNISHESRIILAPLLHGAVKGALRITQSSFSSLNWCAVRHCQQRHLWDYQWRLLLAETKGNCWPPGRKGPDLPHLPPSPYLTFPWGKCFPAISVKLLKGPDKFVPTPHAALFWFTPWDPSLLHACLTSSSSFCYLSFWQAPGLCLFKRPLLWSRVLAVYAQVTSGADQRPSQHPWQWPAADVQGRREEQGKLRAFLWDLCQPVSATGPEGHSLPCCHLSFWKIAALKKYFNCLVFFIIRRYRESVILLFVYSRRMHFCFGVSAWWSCGF